MNHYYDSAVIGAGINGSYAALQLARKGQKTVLIEQFPIPHCRGSSGGQSRITRLGNDKNPALTSIMKDSYEQWGQLQKKTKTNLLRPSPAFNIFYGMDRNDHTIENTVESLKECRQVPVWWDINAFNETYRTAFPKDSLILEDTAAGVLMADQCIKTVQEEFKSYGGIILDEFSVENICTENKSTLLLVGSKRSVVVSSLVICAGPWTGNLLHQLGLDLPLRPVKIGVYYWAFKVSGGKSCSFMDKRGDTYGLPEIEYPGLVKICYHDGPESNPDAREFTDISDVRAKMCAYIKKMFPALNSNTPAIEETCMYTMTPDKEMILDRVPDHENIAFVAGFNGTGFKTAPAVGEILSDLATGKVPRFDISPYSCKRFDRNQKRSRL